MTTADNISRSEVEQEIVRLEAALLTARGRLERLDLTTSNLNGAPASLEREDEPAKHTLLLLADSALPLGSFAFSSGLESYLAHHQPRPPFPFFLALSIDSLASTALPYVLSAYQNPSSLEDLDNNFDASTLCTVARRASVAQGRALLGVWERSLRAPNTIPSTGSSETLHTSVPKKGTDHHSLYASRAFTAAQALTDFARVMKNHSTSSAALNGHFAPLWALVCCSQSIGPRDTAYVFLLNHAKAVVSAAVRAAVLGPYAAQGLLASGWLRGVVNDALQENWETDVEDAGQCAPVLDLWIGRHELLYSRIFNS